MPQLRDFLLYLKFLFFPFSLRCFSFCYISFSVKVFQQRANGTIDFYRGWEDYKTGFGDLNVEFWLGNDNIHLLTSNHNQKLKIELITPANEIAYADYDSFWIENEEETYLVNISGYSGAHPPGRLIIVKIFHPPKI